MDRDETFVAQILERLRNGDYIDVEIDVGRAPASVVPLLARAFRTETDLELRADLLKALWHRCEDAVVPVLEEALHDAADRIWKEALDGFVALGSPAARAALEVARRAEPDMERRAWIDEAIEQIDDAPPLAVLAPISRRSSGGRGTWSTRSGNRRRFSTRPCP